MNRQDQQTYKRAVSAALLGLGTQVVVAGGLMILGMSTGNASLLDAAWCAMGGLGVWLCLAVVYQQHKLQAIESLEAEQLAARHGADSSIFQTNADDLAVAGRRLAWLYKWIVPLTSIATAAYLVGVGILLSLRIGAELSPRSLQNVAAITQASRLPLNHGTALVVCMGLVFIAFLISRYIAGMAKQSHWQLLRGGAGHLMGSVLVEILLSVALVFLRFEMPLLLRYMALVIPVFMIVVGTEIVLNFILDIYRPRRPGEIPRPAFDSRLLSLLTSPESIAKTINEAINYQFGFEITRSWFWQLLSRAFGWLVVFGAIVMVLFSCIVVVQPYQQAVVLNFGRRVGQPLRPGIHIKAPWPIGVARHYDVTTIRELGIGSAEEHKPGEPILWTNAHFTNKPENLIVASSRAAAKPSTAPDENPDKPKAPDISLVNAEIYLYYRIDPDNLIDYITSNADVDDPADMQLDRLRNLAISEVSRHLLRSDIDAWIGGDRGKAGADLQKIIQAKADASQLGIQVVNVAVTSIHPPQEAAESFHNVVAGQLQKQTTLQTAYQDATKILTTTAGSADRAHRIMAQIQQIERLKKKEGETGVESPEAAKQAAALEQLLLQAGGNAAISIADARGYRWEKENGERGKADRFVKQVEAYRLAPSYYAARRFYEVLQESMIDSRKYILVGDSTNLTIRADLKDLSNKIDEIVSQMEGKPK